MNRLVQVTRLAVGNGNGTQRGAGLAFALLGRAFLRVLLATTFVGGDWRCALEVTLVLLSC